MIHEIVYRGRHIHEKDRTIHSFANNLTGKFKTLLSRGSVQVDPFFTYLHSAIIERDGSRTTGALGLDMFCLRIECLDERRLTCPKAPKTTILYFSSAIRVRWVTENVYRFGREGSTEMCPSPSPSLYYLIIPFLETA